MVAILPRSQCANDYIALQYIYMSKRRLDNQHIEVETNWPPFYANDIFKCIPSNEKVPVSFKIPLQFVPNVSTDNKPSLVQAMA